MIFRETALHGAYLIELEPHVDDRGFFARAWCREEFEAHGLNPDVVQANVSYNKRRGTLRGLHYQRAPFEEAKMMRCVRGATYNVIIDLRPASESYLAWYGTELTADNRRMLYVPEGFANGYMALADDTEVFYMVTTPYTPGVERGIRFDDPAFAIDWPLPVSVVSEKDRSWPDFERAAHDASTPARADVR